MAITMRQQGLTLTYFRTLSAPEEFERALDAAGADLETPALLRCDCLVLAASIATGAPVGLLGAAHHQEGILHLVALEVAPGAAEDALLAPRMFGFALLCLERDAGMPRVIATASGLADPRRLLQTIAPRLPGATLFPDPAGAVVSFAAAMLAARLSRETASQMTILDLRAAQVMEVLAAAREAFRARAQPASPVTCESAPHHAVPQAAMAH